MQDHDESKLPKWAQKRLDKLRQEIHEREALKKLHGLLCDADRQWFTIQGPPSNDNLDYIALWVFYNNRPHQVCSIGKGDILFVGRAKE